MWAQKVMGTIMISMICTNVLAWLARLAIEEEREPFRLLGVTVAPHQLEQTLSRVCSVTTLLLLVLLAGSMLLFS